jgi:hypothetical protein
MCGEICDIRWISVSGNPEYSLVYLTDGVSLDTGHEVVQTYEACPESKDTKVLNMYNIFNLQSDTVNELPVYNFIFHHSRRHYPNIY